MLVLLGLAVAGALVTAESPAPSDPPAARIAVPGEVSISASGGDVPAFSGVVTAPHDVVVTAPSAAKLSIDRTTSFPVTWTGGGTSVVSATLYMWTNRTVAISCAELASGGGLVVPAIVVAKLPPPLPDDQGLLLIETVNDASVTAGTHTIVLRASSQTATYVLETVN